MTKINIGVFGASGRMGKEVIREIVNYDNCILHYSYAPKSNNNLEELFNSDVIIDFSTPNATLQLVREAQKFNKKIVCGTTGFSSTEFLELQKASEAIPILYSANMSIGINAIEYLLEILDKKLPKDFDVDIIDMHHKHKKDKPSGTALMLKEAIKFRNTNISSIRAGEIIGSHELYFSGNDEQITIKHQAFSRKIFASTAIKAAIFLFDQSEPGFYSINDILTNNY